MLSNHFSTWLCTPGLTGVQLWCSTEIRNIYWTTDKQQHHGRWISHVWSFNLSSFNEKIQDEQKEAWLKLLYCGKHSVPGSCAHVWGQNVWQIIDIQSKQRLRPGFICEYFTLMFLSPLNNDCKDVQITLHGTGVYKKTCQVKMMSGAKLLDLAFQSETLFYKYQGFSCPEEHQINEASKSKQEYILHLMLYKAYTGWQKFPLSSVLQTRFDSMPADFLMWLAAACNGMCQTLLVCGLPRQASCYFSLGGRYFASLGWLPMFSFRASSRKNNMSQTLKGCCDILTWAFQIEIRRLLQHPLNEIGNLS